VATAGKKRHVLRRALPAVAVVALALAASAAARKPHDPQQKPNAADMARARELVVHKFDLVGTWKAEKSKSNDDTTCKAHDPDLSDLIVTGKAESPDFTRADGVLISSSAEVYDAAEQMRASFDRFVRPAVITCVDQALREGAKPATTKMLMGRRAPIVRYGDRTARYQFVWTITDQGKTVKAYADIYLLGKDRKGVTIFIFSSPDQVTAAAQRALVKRVADRL
jgi:hypothetical protein